MCQPNMFFLHKLFPRSCKLVAAAAFPYRYGLVKERRVPHISAVGWLLSWEHIIINIATQSATALRVKRWAERKISV